MWSSKVNAHQLEYGNNDDSNNKYLEHSSSCSGGIRTLMPALVSQGTVVSKEQDEGPKHCCNTAYVDAVSAAKSDKTP
ncbi:TPA: hypothetical protein ACN976_004941 [Vibrio campbellii]|uniref:hypothetical protein n=1 Tax=Vibrio campbellii TaxID=680 RepID=UPI0013B04DF5|nr:hypothetical protein [Vibrio campbellii]HBC3421921.1 hypothetical protein [Vibrio parahaemolyticus]HBC3883723.1 hypothetical protein [Vibrio parahaemolyticus]HBC3907987.1 hypothetical protein [Vibrio parahaemolyticus]